MRQAKQVILTRKQVISSRFILWLFGISVILAFLGTVLTIARSVDHVVYPAWIQVPWDTINILLMPVAYVGILSISLGKAQSRFRWIEFFFDIALVILGIYVGYTSNCLSVMLFIFLAMAFLVIWGRLPDEIYTKQ